VNKASPSDLAQQPPGGTGTSAPLFYESEGVHTRTGQVWRVWQSQRSEPARAEIVGSRGRILWLRKFGDQFNAHAQLALELRRREEFAPLPMPPTRRGGFVDPTAQQPPSWHGIQDGDDDAPSRALPPGQL